MATNYLVLGQVNPASATLQTLYTVPSSTQAVVSTVTACNTASTISTFRVAVRPGGAAASAQHYVVYDAPLAANSTTALTLGITLNASDVISVRGSTGNLAFSAFGTEITP